MHKQPEEVIYTGGLAKPCQTDLDQSILNLHTALIAADEICSNIRRICISSLNKSVEQAPHYASPQAGQLVALQAVQQLAEHDVHDDAQPDLLAIELDLLPRFCKSSPGV